MIRTTFLAGACALALTATPAIAQDTAEGDTTQRPGNAPIAETIGGDSSAFAISTLLIKRAGLEETLNGEGPFTLFVPTDNAYAKLPDETLQALLDEDNTEKLAELLRGHVVGEALPAGAFIDGSRDVETMAGTTITVEGKGELLLRNPAAPEVRSEDGTVALEPNILEASVPLVTITNAGGATPGEGGEDGVEGSIVVLPDITATNGVIHAISDVLVPQGFTEGM